MTRNYSILVLLIAIFLYNATAQNPRYVESRDLSVLINVSSESMPKPKITLTWEKNELAHTYAVSRKLNGAFSFGSPIATFDSLTNTFIDSTVTPGVAYEYEVAAYSVGSINTKTNQNKDTIVAIDCIGFGYVLAGVDMPPDNEHKTVLLLIDETFASSLSQEIDILINDLVTEGWTVKRRNVARSTTFDGEAVFETREIINEVYAEDHNLNTIFIIGRVAVPYSGKMNPDGHGDHIGAWPADIYYGVNDTYTWNDWTINDTSASRKANRNVPGDGKFDMSAVNANSVVYAVGRVDFYDMPQFTTSELELIRQYLNKNHLYRTGQVETNGKGIVSDNFGARTYIEAFASNGWRNIASLCGSKNVSSANFFNTLTTDSYLWAYGCGGGTYTSAGGIGSTADFATKQPEAIFTMLFGSYFGDWDSQNNFLRASIASSPSILTCCWAARPGWYFHHMGAGYPIGYSTRLSQNNSATYKPNAYDNYIYVFGINGVHMALMGDPTLSMYSSAIAEPTIINLTQPPGGRVQIDWQTSKDLNEDGYYVYKAYSKEGPYERISDAMLDEKSLVDSNLYEGQVYYMVRNIKKIQSPSGSFYCLGRGLINNLTVTSAEDEIADNSFSVSPNPAISVAQIDFSLSKESLVTISIIDINGREVATPSMSTLLAKGEHHISWDLRDYEANRVAAGVYLVKVQTGDFTKVLKLVVR